MTPFTHPVLPDCVTAQLVGDNIYLTVKGEERLERNNTLGRNYLYHRETVYCVNRWDFMDAVEELPNQCHVNILLPAFESRLVSEGLVSRPAKEAA